MYLKALLQAVFFEKLGLLVAQRDVHVFLCCVQQAVLSQGKPVRFNTRKCLSLCEEQACASSPWPIPDPVACLSSVFFFKHHHCFQCHPVCSASFFNAIHLSEFISSSLPPAALLKLSLSCLSYFFTRHSQLFWLPVSHRFEHAVLLHLCQLFSFFFFVIFGFIVCTFFCCIGF